MAGLAGRLEFEQKVDIEPILASVHAPDQVIGTVTEVVTDIAAAAFFQGGQVQFIDPFFVTLRP